MRAAASLARIPAACALLPYLDPYLPHLAAEQSPCMHCNPMHACAEEKKDKDEKEGKEKKEKKDKEGKEKKEKKEDKDGKKEKKDKEGKEGKESKEKKEKKEDKAKSDAKPASSRAPPPPARRGPPPKGAAAANDDYLAGIDLPSSDESDDDHEKSARLGEETDKVLHFGGR